MLNNIHRTVQTMPPPGPIFFAYEPASNDDRPRNAFGFLKGFGEAYAAYYAQRDLEKQTRPQAG